MSTVQPKAHRADDAQREHYLSVLTDLAAGEFLDGNQALRALAQAMLAIYDFEIVAAPPRPVDPPT